MVAPVVGAIVGLLVGGSLPAALGIGIIPTEVFGIARSVDSVATAVASHTQSICRATDPVLDRLADAEDAKLGRKVTLWRRLEDGVARAADAACKHASEPNNIVTRVTAVRDAIKAASEAQAQLDIYEGKLPPAVPRSPTFASGGGHAPAHGK